MAGSAGCAQERRNRSPLKVKMPAPSGSAPVGGTALPLYPRCSCCPFGYHIDLDFINYCQSLGKADLSQGQKLRRDRRRQRQSMEIMLGLGPMFQQMDTLQMLPKVGEVRKDLRLGGQGIVLFLRAKRKVSVNISNLFFTYCDRFAGK